MRLLPVLLVLLMISSFTVRAENPTTELSGVRQWLLLLNNDLDDDVVTKIQASSYDMVVIDDVSSQRGADPAHSEQVVKRLRTKPDGNRRLVIAYLNVGQAEDYRVYWKRGWRAGSPRFILGTDPEGWQGNYPVAYWRQDWKSLITGPDGLVDRIQRAGFDGVYLDWIGGFEDEGVLAAARRDHVSARVEMVKWVGEVSSALKQRSPDFLVIGQNAAGLLSDDKYLAAIDAVAHEDIWFTGADRGPSGDCPVPRTQKELSSGIYLKGLDAKCLKAFKANTAGAMHFPGLEAVVPVLQSAQMKGKPVFTVDYASQQRNISKVMNESRNLGFVPFVGSRELSSFVPVVDEAHN